MQVDSHLQVFKILGDPCYQNECAHLGLIFPSLLLNLSYWITLFVFSF